MAKRQKIVHDTGMVAHLWANKSQPEARNPRGNLFFENETLYSYGRHFAVGKHVTSKHGERAVLLTTRTYSTTTAGHIGLADHSTLHLRRFFVSNVEHESENTRKSQFADYKERFAKLGCKYVKARQNKPRILREMESLATEANAFARFFGLRTRLKMPADTDKWQEECKAINAKEAARRRDNEKKRELDRQERIASDTRRLARWVAGEDCYHGGFGYSTPVKLRIVGDTVQTSKGAEVPLEHAAKLFKVVSALKAKGETYRRNGHTIHVGHFALDSVDASGNIKAGCHDITWEELERVAKLAGVA